VCKVSRGLTLAVDYGHSLGTRPRHPTLTGFRDGREVEPLLDGSTDITCHVAMDSVGAAGGQRYQMRSQREMLKALGVDGARPPLELAHSSPREYLRRLAEASEAATLTDPAGLGGHWWLWHELGIRLSK
jgi:SAM-dependent MidA family methyltransferase